MKHIKEVNDTLLFDQIDQQTPLDEKLFIATSIDIAHQIVMIMEHKNMLHKDLAKILGKTEEEISWWLSGFYNFTIETISKIQAVLGAPIIITPKPPVLKISRINLKNRNSYLSKNNREVKHRYGNSKEIVATLSK